AASDRRRRRHRQIAVARRPRAAVRTIRRRAMSDAPADAAIRRIKDKALSALVEAVKAEGLDLAEATAIVVEIAADWSGAAAHAANAAETVRRTLLARTTAFFDATAAACCFDEERPPVWETRH